MDEKIIADIKQQLMDFYENVSGVDLELLKDEPDEYEQAMTLIDAYVYRVQTAIDLNA